MLATFLEIWAWLGRLFWVTFKVGFWIWALVIGLIIGDYVADKYL